MLKNIFIHFSPTQKAKSIKDFWLLIQYYNYKIPQNERIEKSQSKAYNLSLAVLAVAVPVCTCT